MKGDLCMKEFMKKFENEVEKRGAIEQSEIAEGRGTVLNSACGASQRLLILRYCSRRCAYAAPMPGNSLALLARGATNAAAAIKKVSIHCPPPPLFSTSFQNFFIPKSPFISR